MSFFNFYSSNKSDFVYTLGFYNLENLFDTRDDLNTKDNDFLPGSSKRWNRKRYRKKINKLAEVISKLGYEKARKVPSLLGVAEVENKKVLQDLLYSKHLRDETLDFVHFDSQDERGIDTALIYNKKNFEPINSKTLSIFLTDDDGTRDYTRDILKVKGNLNGEAVYVFVNHWPSRYSGEEETRHKRLKAAQVLKKELNRIKANEKDPTFIIMGDFNDNPKSETFKQHLNEEWLHNPMLDLHENNRGTLKYNTQWNLFDQILLSSNLLDVASGTHTFTRADIYDRHFISRWKGKFKGSPFRTYAGRKYLGGFSDHFPVYVHLKLHV